MVIIIIIIIYLSHTDAASINFRIAVVILGTWRKKNVTEVDWLINSVLRIEISDTDPTTKLCKNCHKN